MSIGLEIYKPEDFSPEELLEEEREAHKAFTPWVANHSFRSREKEPKHRINDLGYDRRKFSYQRLDVPYTPPARTTHGIPIKLIPNTFVMREIRHKLTENVGSKTKVDNMVESFSEVSEEVAEMIYGQQSV